MLKSAIVTENGRPLINIDGENFSPLAYTAYFDECGQWEDFIKSGYRMFFVNVSFTSLPINNSTGFTPFRTGVFEGDEPDFSEFDGIVRAILSLCPDAFIFPRINISMPRKWIAENREETVMTPRGGARESLYSDKFRRDGAELLKRLISHIRTLDYAPRIAGYHLCGGTTQEWMHHDLAGSYSPLAAEKFRLWAKEKYGISDITLPPRSELLENRSTEGRLYSEFSDEKVSETVNYFARTVKELTDGEQVVGVFYGYNAFVNEPFYGLHGLHNIIDSPYIDFFSSPCCYDGGRRLGIDWGDMLPVDSVKKHGKLCFIECDVRTHLTRRMQDSRPGEYPDDIYLLYNGDGSRSVWCGPEAPELSRSAVRKAFLHQLTKASGIWWFDMWGGWYKSRELMQGLREIREIAEKAKNKAPDSFPRAETVLFIDESAYRNTPAGSCLRHSVNEIRVAIGNTGIPFDTYMVEDAPEVLKLYKAAVFTAPVPSEAGKKALALCKSLDIPYIAADEGKPSYNTQQLRGLLACFGVHCYNHDGCVIYCNKGYLGIHTVCDGETRITLPRKFRLRALFGEGRDIIEADTVELNLPRHSTEGFELLGEAD